VETRHHFGFWPTAIGIFAVAMPIAFAWLYWEREGDLASVPDVAWLSGLGVGTALSLLFAFLMRALMFSTVGPNGLRGWNIWNTRKQIAWEEIAECRGLAFPVFPFVRVLPKTGGSAIWQPLFLTRPQAFCDAVKEHAGEEHALTRYLAEQLAA
jgi:hypothetical protein